MVVDRKWVVRDTGYDPTEKPAPKNTFTVAEAAVKSPAPEDLRREIIDFDSESPAGLEFFALTKATGLSRFTDIPWPSGLAPKTGQNAERHRWQIAEGRHAGGDMDGRRGACAEQGIHARQGFPQRLRLLQTKFAAISREGAKAVRRGGEAAGGVLDDEDQRQESRRLQV